jgi:hypothetical protein
MRAIYSGDPMASRAHGAIAGRAAAPALSISHGRAAALASLAAMLFSCAACGGGDSSGSASRDVRLAPGAGSQAAGNDAPAPQTGSSGLKKFLGVGPKLGTIAAGTVLSVHPASKVCTNTHKTGAPVTAILTAAVQGTNGAVIPAGSTVDLKVAESVRSEDSKDKAKLAFSVVAVRIGNDSYPLAASVSRMSALEMVRVQSTTRQAEKVGAGAAIGAIAGQVLGKNTRSTVVGAAVGTAAGAVVAAGTADYNGCLPAEGTITITLDAPVKIKAGAKATAAGA